MRAFLILLLACACATPPPPKPAHLDPSSPDAPEAPLPAKSNALVLEPLHDPAPAPAEKGSGFTCPMHPEIDQPEPGRCPKCGMNLVPKEATPAPGHEHHHPGGSR